jgi:hypothetical protein
MQLHSLQLAANLAHLALHVELIIEDYQLDCVQAAAKKTM